MEIADKVIESADKLSSCVHIEKCVLRGNIYVIDKRSLDDELRSLMHECKKFIAEKLSSEMRHSDNDEASQSCEDVTIFATMLLKSKMDNRLKIALFKELNIVGYMFDRDRNNYRVCSRSLYAFLNQVEKFKCALSESDMVIWNKTSHGGAEQVPFFRGYLQGITRN